MGRQHVAVFAFPFGTHAAPLLLLVRRLARAVPTAKFSFFSTAKSNAYIFSKHDDVDHKITVYNVSDGVPGGHLLSGNPLEGVELFLKAAPGNFREGMEAAEMESGVKVSCFLTDAFLWFAAEMAEERCVPWLPLWTSAPVSLAVHLYTHDIRDIILGPNRSEGINEEQVIDFIPGLSSIHAVDLPEDVISSNIDSPFSQMLYNMGLSLPRAAAVAINSFEEMDPTLVNHLKLKLNNFVNIGPFNLLSSPPPTPGPDPSGCLPWLDKQEAASVAYISFGTVITPPPQEVVAVAEALEATGGPFLWSLKDHIAKNNLPKGFVERTKGKVVSWAPQLQVLEHPSIGVFVTHCGWNSVTESIVNGVPMICRPFFGDQKLNRRMVEDVWRIGVGVQGGVFTKTGLATSLELVFGNEGSKMRHNIGVFKHLARKAVGPNGSSTINFSILSHLLTPTT